MHVQVGSTVKEIRNYFFAVMASWTIILRMALAVMAWILQAVQTEGSGGCGVGAVNVFGTEITLCGD